MKAGRLRRALAILAWLPVAAAAADVPPAQDLARDAQQLATMRIPMLILYSQADCRWCERVRREYLGPMQRDPSYRARVVLRQIDLDAPTALVDFAGRATTHIEFARAEGARVTPTVQLYGPKGERLGEAIVGFRIPDFYAAYIDAAIDQATAKLRGP